MKKQAKSRNLEHGPSYPDLRRRVVVFAAAFTALALFVAGLGFFWSRAAVLDAATARAQSYSHVLAAHLRLVMSAMDARLEQIALQSPRLGGPAGPNAPWQAVLDAARGGSASIGSISVTDARGVIRHSTLRALIGQSRRERFLMQGLSDPTAPDLLSDAPMRSPYTGDLLLPFGRRLRSPSGRIEGAVVVTFWPESLRDFYGSVDTEGGVVRVLHRSGAEVLREPARSRAAPGAQDPVLEAFRDGAAQGAFIGREAPGGPALITSFSAVADTGLVVAVSLNEAAALAAWRADALGAGAALVGVLTAFWIAVALVLRQLRAREAAEVALAEQQRRFTEARRMESIGQLTGGVAHDFNNLLTVIVNAADSMLSRVSADLRPRLEAILHAADNGAALVRQLLAFSRRQTLSFASVDVNAVAAEMEDMLKRTLGGQIEIAFVLAPDLWRAYADRAQIESALLNLAINARDAMPGGGKLTVETHNAHLDEQYAAHNPDVTPGDYVALAVSDTGAGMSPEVVERAHEPFFTTKEVGKGSGLGLSMIYGFAKQSKGHLKIYSELGRGTTVRLYLPRDMGEASVTPGVIGAGEDSRGEETILVVEDDAQVRALAAASLRERGYTVIEAVGAREALEVLSSDEPAHLMLTDIVIPGPMTGRELGEQALALRPGIKVLFTSGYADASVMRNGLVRAGARFLSKPYRGGELATAVRALLDAGQ